MRAGPLWTAAPAGITGAFGRCSRASTNAMIAVIVVVIVLFNLPASAITKAVSPVVDSIAVPLGLDQNWALFAPQPPLDGLHIRSAGGTEHPQRFAQFLVLHSIEALAQR